MESAMPNSVAPYRSRGAAPEMARHRSAVDAGHDAEPETARRNAVGAHAVRAAERSSSDMASYAWINRAYIVGTPMNTVTAGNEGIGMSEVDRLRTSFPRPSIDSPEDVRERLVGRPIVRASVVRTAVGSTPRLSRVHAAAGEKRDANSTVAPTRCAQSHALTMPWTWCMGRQW